MPPAHSNSQCPYCDHVSPVGSKFCNDCGAALHLRPCPHCGSVNDITLNTHCSRCNGDLGLSPAAAEPIASVEPPLLNEEIEASVPITATFADANPSAGRSYAPLFGIALIAVAVFSYYGLRSEPDAAPAAAALSAIPAQQSPIPLAAVEPSTPASTAAPVQASEAAAPVASAPAASLISQEAAPMPAATASLAKLSPPAARRLAPPPPAAAAASPGSERYSAGPRNRGAAEGLDLKQPNIDSCTDAVAALGLCTLESNPRRP